VAVVAENYLAAVAAQGKMRVTWDKGPHANVTTESITQDYWNKAKNDTSSPSWVDVGDADGALAKSMKTHEAAFWTDYVGHAPLEPMTASRAIRTARSTSSAAASSRRGRWATSRSCSA